MHDHSAAVKRGETQSRPDHLNLWDFVFRCYGSNKQVNGYGDALTYEYTNDSALLELDASASGQTHADLWNKDPETATARLFHRFMDWSYQQLNPTKRFFVIVDKIGNREAVWKEQFAHVNIITSEDYLERYAN